MIRNEQLIVYQNIAGRYQRLCDDITNTHSNNEILLGQVKLALEDISILFRKSIQLDYLETLNEKDTKH